MPDWRLRAYNMQLQLRLHFRDYYSGLGGITTRAGAAAFPVDFDRYVLLPRHPPADLSLVPVIL